MKLKTFIKINFLQKYIYLYFYIKYTIAETDMNIEIKYPMPQLRALAGCGITTTAYTAVWISLQAVNTLNKLTAIRALGLVSVYNHAATKKTRMFSISFKWALKQCLQILK